MDMLYRKITSYIEDYLKSDNDKILILEGARQIGKSFSIRGQAFYDAKRLEHQDFLRLASLI